MQMFASYEEENIDYWTKRTPGYLEVNQGELASRQRGLEQRHFPTDCRAVSGKDA